MNTCMIDLCPTPIKSRGLCTKHYAYHKYHGTLETIALPSTVKPTVRHTLSDIDTEAKTATCSVCGPTAIIKSPSMYNWNCKTPRQQASKAFDKKRGYVLNHSSYFYGDGNRVNAAEARKAREIFAEIQNGRCAICKRTESEVGYTLHLDHCHSTGKLRGLLCRDCNHGLGRFRDDPELLTAASEYLTR